MVSSFTASTPMSKSFSSELPRRTSPQVPNFDTSAVPVYVHSPSDPVVRIRISRVLSPFPRFRSPGRVFLSTIAASAFPPTASTSNRFRPLNDPGNHLRPITVGGADRGVHRNCIGTPTSQSVMRLSCRNPRVPSMSTVLTAAPRYSFLPQQLPDPFTSSMQMWNCVCLSAAANFSDFVNTLRLCVLDTLGTSSSDAYSPTPYSSKELDFRLGVSSLNTRHALNCLFSPPSMSMGNS
mmetsp:Transcript_9887/g.30216  ORF Transcript_9887/g.30216 Transcript_9887/m.30216 type:complete len:237 (+) Transcript_9887:755-1465(+)